MLDNITFKVIFLYWTQFQQTMLDFLITLTKPFGVMFEEWANKLFGVTIDLPSFILLDMTFFDMILVWLPVLLVFAFIAFLYNVLIDFVPF